MKEAWVAYIKAMLWVVGFLLYPVIWIFIILWILNVIIEIFNL